MFKKRNCGSLPAALAGVVFEGWPQRLHFYNECWCPIINVRSAYV
jgi:hypothetical protein